MATEDNIISDFLYGESSYIYAKFGEENHNKIMSNALVFTQKVVSRSTEIKHYIIFGQKCCICYEKILTTKTAFINDCGHYFHRKCIFKYENMCCNQDRNTPCPLCRKDIDIFGVFDKYNSSHKNFNFLDKLENFYDDNKFHYDISWCRYCKKFNIGQNCTICSE